ncbi:MAG: glycosyltransferase [Clostridium sp.]|nr:glycosyltransferase [Prevotella sp.]MCM1428612.1 glycosyltransferase [Clostridium sp.]MCM1476189.1 glycosyltransferase [Muribaculaceae bacterium]
MKKAPRISIVVPVYNVERYIKECIRSVITQDFPDWELLLVDDGSTDNSGKICDSFAQRDSRIIAMHVKNGGPSHARNHALNHSRGEYLTFVDPDDTIATNYLSALLRAIEKTGADISVCKFSTKQGGLTTPGNSRAYRPKIYSGVEVAEAMLYQRGMDCSSSCKLYKKRLFADKRYREGIYYEDLDIIPRIVIEAEKIAAIDARLYYYRQREGSITHVFNDKRLDVLDVTARLRRELPQTLRAAASDRAFSAACNMLELLAIHDRSESPEADRCWRIIQELRSKSLANRKVRAKNRLGSLTAILLGRRGTIRLIRLLRGL